MNLRIPTMLAATLLLLSAFPHEMAAQIKPDFAIARLTPRTRFILLDHIGKISPVNEGIFGVETGDGEWQMFRAKDGSPVTGKIRPLTGRERDIPAFNNGALLARSTTKASDGNYPLVIYYNDGTRKKLPSVWKDATNFVDGVAAVRTYDTARHTTIFYIDTEGKQIYPSISYAPGKMSYEELLPPKKIGEQLRPYYDYAKKLWGYIDNTGKIVVSPRYSDARTFSEGMAAVTVTKDYKTHVAFINKTGEEVITPDIDIYGALLPKDLSDVKEGVIRFADYKGTSYYNTAGKLLKRYERGFGTMFFGGKAMLREQAGNMPVQIIDKNFNSLKEFKPDYAWTFDPDEPAFNVNGIASVQSRSWSTSPANRCYATGTLPPTVRPAVNLKSFPPTAMPKRGPTSTRERNIGASLN